MEANRGICTKETIALRLTVSDADTIRVEASIRIVGIAEIATLIIDEALAKINNLAWRIHGPGRRPIATISEITGTIRSWTAIKNQIGYQCGRTTLDLYGGGSFRFGRRIACCTTARGRRQQYARYDKDHVLHRIVPFP